jgi:hypothetical protein
MMTPQNPGGVQASTKAQIHVVLKLLENSLPALGSDSEGGKAVLGAIKALIKGFGESASKDKEMMPAEIKQLMEGLAGPGSPKPGQPGPPGAGGPPPGAGAPPPM